VVTSAAGWQPLSRRVRQAPFAGVAAIWVEWGLLILGVANVANQ